MQELYTCWESLKFICFSQKAWTVSNGLWWTQLCYNHNRYIVCMYSCYIHKVISLWNLFYSYNIILSFLLAKKCFYLFPSPTPHKSITQSQTLISLCKQKTRILMTFPRKSLCLCRHTHRCGVLTLMSQERKNTHEKKNVNKKFSRAFIFVYRGGPWTVGWMAGCLINNAEIIVLPIYQKPHDVMKIFPHTWLRKYCCLHVSGVT